jgi:chromosome segregation ATPase
LRDMESELHTAQRTLSAEREKSDLAYSLTVDGLESKLTLSSKRLQELSEENTQLQVYLRKKTTELANMERSLKESADLHSELQHNLETCMNKNQQLIERIKLIENECQEHRAFSHKSVTRT